MESNSRAKIKIEYSPKEDAFYLCNSNTGNIIRIAAEDAVAVAKKILAIDGHYEIRET